MFATKKKTKQAERRLDQLDFDTLQRRASLAIAGLATAAKGAQTLLAATQPPRKRRRKRKLLALLGLGGGAYYALTQKRDRLPSPEVVRETASTVAHTAAEHAQNIAAKAQEVVSREGASPNDQALTDKVKTEIFRDNDLSGAVNVNVAGGVVYLRGQVESQSEIDSLAAAASAVEGVAKVHNLLHLPGTDAPTLDAHDVGHTEQAGDSEFAASGTGKATGHATDDRTS